METAVEYEEADAGHVCRCQVVYCSALGAFCEGIARCDAPADIKCVGAAPLCLAAGAARLAQMPAEHPQ